ncbi:hypothetical protein GCM10027570_43530 [Streptomonospora sediminis]
MPLDLLRHRPEMAATLLEISGVDIPDHDQAAMGSTECPDMQPKDYKADGVVTFTRAGVVRMAVVVEVQSKPAVRKAYSWPVYVATVRARLECPTVLLVICDQDATARWAAEPIALGNPDSYLVPLVLGPQQMPVVTTPEEAREMPEITILSAVTHGDDNEKTLLASIDALKSLPEEESALYYDFLRSMLSEGTWKKLEDMMEKTTDRYHSEFARKYASQGKVEGLAEGREEGKAEAKAESVLRVLKARGITISEDNRTRITTCTDPETLNTWLDRAVDIHTADQLFA